ncbi:MAG TPA: DNA-binding protein [Lachnospiraceae bacterium]|nr:DNA-binding protein [Lachnospiraceae bacterium]
MTKPEFIDKVAQETTWTKKDAEVAINAVVKAITDSLVAGEKLAIVGFGTFEVAERAERQARNPKTGESILVSACKAPKFKPAKALKELVNAK